MVNVMLVKKDFNQTCKNNVFSVKFRIVKHAWSKINAKNVKKIIKLMLKGNAL